MPGINSLTGSIGDTIGWTASNDIAAQQPMGQNDSVATSYAFGTANDNDAVGGADELISFLQTIAPGGSAVINLQSITNILQQSGVALVRLKGYKIRLLTSGTKGAVDSVNGTLCSSISVGNAAANPHPLEMDAGTYTYTIKNGGSHQHFDPSAAGFALVTPSAKNVLITNNDGSVAAAVQVTIVGATT